MFKGQFEKKWPMFFWKRSGKGVYGENLSSLAWKMAKIAFLMLHSGRKWPKIDQKKIDHSVLKKIRQGVYGENLSSLAWKMQS